LRISRPLSDNQGALSSPSKRRAAPERDERGVVLRAIPPIDECLRAAEQSPALERLSRRYLKMLVRRAQDGMRTAIAAGRHDVPADREAMLEVIARAVEHEAAADEPALRPLVNATGVVLHTNLGRAILAEAAIEAVGEAARSAVNLEFNLADGTRGDRDDLVERELTELTGAEAATVVNNNAAAVLLALNTIAEGREAIVSRGELIEIGGAFRIPEVMKKSGARLCEVGTTNRTHPADYANAITPETALILKVHPSNYRIVGFTSEVELGELVEIGHEHGIAVMEDLGSGALVDLTDYGLPREPVVAQRIAAGADIVTFSGDKLLGGPQAGVIVGKNDLIERIKRNPLKRALRCDKLTLAALAATLRLYLRSNDLAAELPTLRLLSRTSGAINVAAERGRDIVAQGLGPEFIVEVVASEAEVGSGAMPVKALESAAIRVTHPHRSPEAIAAMFRRARIIGRITADAFHLDMRTVEDPAALAVQLGPG
jgi:L-seryl-tRNA(Ser) seleniumtransferase